MDDDANDRADSEQFQIETRSIHAGQESDAETGALMTPIHANSTYEQDAPGEHRGYEYSRTGNPTRTDLEANLASLEGADYGRAFASGMASINTVVLNLLRGRRPRRDRQRRLRWHAPHLHAGVRDYDLESSRSSI